MAVDVLWTDPSTSGSLDLATGQVLTETIYDKILSNLKRFGGTDGNCKTGKYQLGGTAVAYSNAFNAAGLTVNQDAADDEAVSLKSSDVAHGMTSIAETDTYGLLQKVAATTGGMTVRGLGETTRALQLEGLHTTDDTTKGTSSLGAVYVNGALKSGTSVTALGANANIISFANNSTTRFILDGDGDSHQDVGTAWTNYDQHDDLALLDAVSALLGRGDRLRKSFTADFLVANRAVLERERIVSFNDGSGEDGRPFINWSRFQMLHMGATRYLGDRLAELTAELTALKAHPALTAA
jgi:hypothetical protein